MGAGVQGKNLETEKVWVVEVGAGPGSESQRGH